MKMARPGDEAGRASEMLNSDQVDLVPQAIVAKPVSYFSERFGNFVHDFDDLDYF
jgi:hypothetical protein